MKNILLIFGLLWALGASGQIYINSFTFEAAPAPQNPLLDDYPGAVRAYSLRKLRTAYTGNCVQVRRVSDGTTSNIGFSAGYLDTASLKTFCASTDCFVSIWYDQSTAASNATQTTLANQPQIAAGGALQYHDGEVVIYTTGTIERFSITSVTPASVFSVAKVDINTSVNIIIGNAANSGLFYGGTQTGRTGIGYVNNGDATILMSSTTNDLNEHLVSAHTAASTDFVTVDGTTVASGSVTGAASTLFLRGGSTFRGKIKEFVVYTSDMSADDSGIRSNINSFYNTY